MDLTVTTLVCPFLVGCGGVGVTGVPSPLGFSVPSFSSPLISGAGCSVLSGGVSGNAPVSAGPPLAP